eukprot:g53804.t1
MQRFSLGGVRGRADKVCVASRRVTSKQAQQNLTFNVPGVKMLRIKVLDPQDIRRWQNKFSISTSTAVCCTVGALYVIIMMNILGPSMTHRSQKY